MNADLSAFEGEYRWSRPTVTPARTGERLTVASEAAAGQRSRWLRIVVASAQMHGHLGSGAVTSPCVIPSGFVGPGKRTKGNRSVGHIDRGDVQRAEERWV